MTVYGRDVAEHQTKTPSLVGKTFLFARATIGSKQDGMYHQHIANARAQGKVVGAYHFNWSTWSVDAQCDAFIAVAGNVDLYALDVEKDSSTNPDTPPFSPAQARAFIKRFHDRTGKAIGLYHSRSGYFDAGQDWNWVAAWGTVRPSNADIWQYQGSPADLDLFLGDRSQLINLGIPSAPDSSVDPPQEVAVNQYDVIHNTLVDVIAGKYLHYNSGLGPDVNNIQAPAGGLKAVELVGNDGAGKYRIVEYKGVAWWVYWADITNMRAKPAPVDTTPFDQADVDAKTAALTQENSLLTAKNTALFTENENLKVQHATDVTKQAETEAKIATAARDEQERIAEAEKTRILDI